MGRPCTVDTGIKERLLQFIEYKGLSKHKFEITCGFASRYVSNIKKTISSRSLKVISSTYPELNIHWLETGEGQMLSEVIPISVQNNTCGNNSQQTIVAGTNNNLAIDEQGRKVIDAVQRMSDENVALKSENAALKAQVAILTEQVEWLRTIVKQQQ